MGSGMNREQAEEYAKTMTYKEAIHNTFCAKGIRYKKATRIKLHELAEIADKLVLCKDCRWRYVDDCPMYHEEWFTVDEGFGFFDDDYNIIDNTTDNGFCHMGERKKP